MGQPDESAQTTHFVHDSSTISATLPLRSNNIGRFIPMQDTPSELSIKDFLSRPLLWTTGNFAVADTITTVNFYDTICNALSTDVWYSKIKGYFGIRFDIKIRVVANPNRYQQGRYMLIYTPSAGARCNTNRPAYLKNLSHMFSLVQRTTCPHVEMDLNCETEMELYIPYQCALPFIPIHSSTQIYDLGMYHLMPYSPLVSPTGTATAGYSLFISLHNVSFQGAAVPQMGTTEEEQKSSGIGPVTSTLKKVSKAATIVSSVPLLSSIAGTVAWATDIASQAANVFGWSKPTILSPHKRVVRNTFQGWNNSDMADASAPISLLATNATVPQPGAFGTDIDEMSINFIAQKYAYFSTITWDDTQAAGTLLWNTQVTPLVFQSQTVAGIGVTSFTPIGFCADMFRLWRGSIKYRFKVVKTEFHSGRLVISYNPFDSDFQGNVTTNYGQTVYLEREIIDLRYGTTFELTVPFMSNRPYRNINSNQASTGNIQVHISDPLTRPSNVSASVSILVEVAAGPDFELAFPDTFNKNPVIVGAMQMNDVSQECEMVSKPIGSMSVGPSSTQFSEVCIGEKILSFRQLLKNTAYCPYAAQPANSGIIYHLPYAWDAVDCVGAGAVQPATNSDYFAIFSSCYAACAGGVRIKLASQHATRNKWLTYLNTTNNNQPFVSFGAASTVATYPNVNKLGLNVPHNPLLCGGMEIQVPMYNSTNIRPTVDGLYHSTVLSATGAEISTCLRLNTYLLETIEPPATARLVADDFSFYGFISIPPMAEYTSPNVAANTQ